MARISYIKAWGLWSHWETVVELAPGLTVIVGPNGSGKTTIERILQWVFLGEPSGEEFLFKRRDENENVIKEAKEGKAEIGLDDGVVITKTRRKGKTTYTHSNFTEPFEKAEVPQEIIDALGIRAYQYGDFKTYLNFAFQLESPFLLSESPSVGAKVLGKIAGTEVIDLSISDVAKRTHKARTEKTLAEKEAQRLEGNLLDYQGLDDIRETVELCEKLVAGAENDYQRKELLTSLDHNLELSQEHITGYAAKLDTLKNVDLIGIKLEDIKKDQQSYDTLLDLLGKLQSTNDVIDKCASQLTIYHSIDAAAAILKGVEKDEQRLADIVSLHKLYTSYAQDANNYKDKLSHLANVEVLGELLEQLESNNVKAETLKDLESKCIKAVHEINEHRERLETIQSVGVTGTLLDSIEANSDRLSVIERLKLDYDVASITAVTLHNKLLTFSNIELAAAQLEQLSVDMDKLHEIESLCNEYYNAQIKEAGERSTLKIIDTELAAAVKELQEAWGEAGGVCPLCEQSIEHKH